MGAVPHGFLSEHDWDAAAMRVSMSQSHAEGGIGTEVFEVAAEGDLSAGDRDRSSLFKVIVEELFSCSALFHHRFLLLFGLGKCFIDVVVQSII